MDPGRIAVLEQAANVIRGRMWPTKTAGIYDDLGEIRDLIKGADPKANLSAMLHHSPLFVSFGRSGWRLAEDESANPSPAHKGPGEIELEDLLHP